LAAVEGSLDRSGGQASGWRLAEAGREASWLVGGWQRSGVAAEASGCEREREGERERGRELINCLPHIYEGGYKC